MNEVAKTQGSKAVAQENTALNGNVFSTSAGFNLAVRMSQALASSTIVPKDYQGNVGNCIIALEMAGRLNTSPMMVMQNLYIVNGRPAWSSQYIIAMINSSRKYKTELQYDMHGSGDTLECTAYAEDYNGHKVTGPKITMQMAKEEGWVSKNGSKWRTMPEVMMRYRAASFFGRLNCPDMIMGIYSTDEVIELRDEDYSVMDTMTQAEEEIKGNANQVTIPETDPKTGEVVETPDAKSEAEAATDGPDF